MNILIGGEAGQGLATSGQLLSKSLVRSGYFILVTQSYQSRIIGAGITPSAYALGPMRSMRLRKLWMY